MSVFGRDARCACRFKLNISTDLAASGRETHRTLDVSMVECYIVELHDGSTLQRYPWYQKF